MIQSIMQETKECYITGDTQGLHKHHIYRGQNRNNSEIYGCWVWLRWDWHDGASYGVHGSGGGELDRKLRQERQEKFEAIYGHEAFIKIFGRNYL